MPVYSYPALRVRQTETGAWLVLFAAPATDINAWAGIPQKTNLGDTETMGFQRTDNQARIRNLVEFYDNPANIVPNPLLCALQNEAQVIFEPYAENSNITSQNGLITIKPESLQDRSLAELIGMVRKQLESRIPELQQAKVSDEKLGALKKQAQLQGLISSDVDVEEDTEDATNDEAIESENNTATESEAATVLVAEESHIQQFWENLAAREQLLRELGPDLQIEEFAGYDREAMEVYLRPAVLVDGQHRLLGAIRAADLQERDREEIEQIAEAIASGVDPDVIQEELDHRRVRHLPVSLLLTSDPAEHVFQFVIVNQKATPIARALLGTIVSTSLSNTELAGVSNRLEQAGVPLTDSRAIDYMVRQPASPFQGLVRRGMNESGDRLDWLVLGSLINIFRKLKGGRLYHQRVDFADVWHRRYLEGSGIVDEFHHQGFDSRYEYWQALDGPWRSVFIRFWTRVRDVLADTRDEETGNYWGAPRSSNLFNKVTLTILCADFFAFLCERGLTIENVESIDNHVTSWLQGVSTSYFSRNWELGGVKKDSPGVRKQWADLWFEYRRDPQRAPATKEYRRVKEA